MRRMQQQLTPGSTSINMTSVFRGYNHNEIIGDGEMFDMTNMSGDRYPILSLRAKRGITSWDVEGQDPVPLTGIHGRDQLVHIRGTKAYYNGLEVGGLNTLSTDTAMVPKKIVSMGAYVCIWPDKMYFNTTDENNMTLERMERPKTVNGEDVQLMMCRGDGTNMGDITANPNPPANPSNGDLWIDQSGSNDVLRQWVSSQDEWQEVATTYVKIQATGIGSGLQEYDVVQVSGLEVPAGVEDPRKQAQVDALNGSMIVYFCQPDYIVVAGLINQSYNALKDNTVHADMTVPDLDYICESNNRLWGCKYGLIDGQVVNEIHASKLGDFRNWNCYMGLSTDSYTASVGTDGEFTGAITQRGYPVFFKENAIHRVSGMTPSSFTIQTTIARGVQRESWRSLAVVNENIYYKARNAVMVYDGNMPDAISDQLGDVLYSDARAGVLGNKYYISMMAANGQWTMFVYDTRYRTWYKEDSVRALGFASVEDELFYIDESENTIVGVKGTWLSDDTQSWTESDFDWSAEFNLIGVNYVNSGRGDSPIRIRNAKYVSMFKIRMYLDPAAHMKLWVKYNDSPIWELMGQRQGSDMRTFVLPVIPKRCDHVRFKLTGTGDAKIYDISRIMEVGGDG